MEGLRRSADTVSGSLRNELLAFLEEDELRHITPLKILSLFGDAPRIVRVEADDECGFLLMTQRAASQWDSEHYPDVTHIVCSAQRAGHARALVRDAIEDLRSRGLSIRYVVRQTRHRSHLPSNAVCV